MMAKRRLNFGVNNSDSCDISGDEENRSDEIQPVDILKFFESDGGDWSYVYAFYYTVIIINILMIFYLTQVHNMWEEVR